MPVVLVEVGGVARSGHEYDDRTGVAYEYPAGRYERWIKTGERFVYQVPGKGYIGSGLIGEIRTSSDSDRLVCDVLSVRIFDEPAPLKDGDGRYYEADTTHWRDKVYWGQGVRPLTEERFHAILAAAGVAVGPDPDPVSSAYADPATARLVEEYSVAVATTAMSEKYGARATVMARNNPGFDILIGTPSSPDRFIEVKGTQAAEPIFFMSEGERQFSLRNAARYTLFVVSGINLGKRTHSHETTREGAVEGDGFELRPSQWRGRIKAPSKNSI